jgi:outer membrane biosynthesis protein TonB
MTMARFHPGLAVAAALVCSVTAGGCNRLSARTAPEPPPPLDVPAPPPRVVEALGTDSPSPGTLVDAPESTAPSTRRPPPRVDAPKPEPKPVEPPPAPVTEVPPPAEPAKPATTLQTTPPEREAALEQEIRAQMALAAKTLNGIDYNKKLSSGEKQQYDQAKSFLARAEEAIRAKNLVFARQLAENAEKMAAQLAGR